MFFQAHATVLIDLKHSCFKGFPHLFRLFHVVSGVGEAAVLFGKKMVPVIIHGLLQLLC